MGDCMILPSDPTFIGELWAFPEKGLVPDARLIGAPSSRWFGVFNELIRIRIERSFREGPGYQHLSACRRSRSRTRVLALAVPSICQQLISMPTRTAR
jgi:hypothetical protein